MRQAQAAIFAGVGELKLVEVPIPSLRRGDCLVKVTGCTICGSDIHSFLGHRHVAVPSILGHEIVGVVEECGSECQSYDGQSIHEGDRVTWSIAIGCGTCTLCQKGLPQKCKTLFKFGHASLDDFPGLSGGLASHCFLPQGSAIFRIPEKLADAVTCPASCATATVCAAFRAMSGCAKQTVLILGAGMLGVTACAYAKEKGAQRIVVLDVNAERLAMAKRFSADEAFHSNDKMNIDDFRKECLPEDETGFDLVVDFTGHPKMMELGLGLLGVGGKCAWVGAVFPTEPVPVTPERLIRCHGTLLGIHNYAPADLGEALEFLDSAHDKYPFLELVAKSFPLKDAAAAFQFALENKPFRVMIQP